MTKHKVVKKAPKKGPAKNAANTNRGGVTVKSVGTMIEETPDENGTPVTSAITPEVEQSRNPSSSASGKKSKPPIGSRENPRTFKGWMEDFFTVADKGGWWQMISVETGYQDGKRTFWDTSSATNGFSSMKKAREFARGQREQEVEKLRYVAEQAWLDHQPAVEPMSIKITKRTTKKEIEGFYQRLLEVKQEMKNPPEQPPFEFEEPEFPKYRVRRRLVYIESEVV